MFAEFGGYDTALVYLLLGWDLCQTGFAQSVISALMKDLEDQNVIDPITSAHGGS